MTRGPATIGAMSTPTPIAGWYPDPENPAAERYWDGSAWTGQRRPGTPAYATPPPAPYGTAPYGTAPYGTAPYGTPYGAPSRANGPAIAGFVLSLVGLFIALFGIIPGVGIALSAVGLSQATKRAAAGELRTGRGLALAGLIIGIVAFIGTFVWLGVQANLRG